MCGFLTQQCFKVNAETPHFTGKETEAQRREITCLDSQRQWVVEMGLVFVAWGKVFLHYSPVLS